MTIPNESHPGWMRAISGQAFHTYEFMATKILMGRLTLAYQRAPSPETAQKCVTDLRAFFERNKEMPKAQADLIKNYWLGAIR